MTLCMIAGRSPVVAREVWILSSQGKAHTTIDGRNEMDPPLWVVSLNARDGHIGDKGPNRW